MDGNNSTQNHSGLGIDRLSSGEKSLRGRRIDLSYAAALAASIAIWLFAIRAPLWLDETGSFWIIRGGFSQIWPNHYPSTTFPAYEYILWLGSKIFGSSEVGLRIPSLMAMLGAGYLLYLAARELFDSELAVISTVLFCLNPLVIFASVDVRPYAFGMLAMNAAILCVVRMRRNRSLGLAVLFGLSSALVIYFHYLLGAILPALLFCFFAVKGVDRTRQWRQLFIALAVFVLAILPVIPSLYALSHNTGSHVFEPKPTMMELLNTFVPVRFIAQSMPITILFYIALAAAFLFAVILTHRRDSQIKIERWQIAVCAALALIPVLLLFGVSAGSPIHIFAERHRVEAASGIALCWALLFTQVKNRGARVIFCLVLVAAAACQGYSSKGKHLYSWKSSLEFAERNASQDNAPVLICSDYPESDYATMPLDSAKESRFFTQLSYYKLSVPVVPMPRTLNDEAVRVGTGLLVESEMNHQRFLALGYGGSYKELAWLAERAEGEFNERVLGSFDGVVVVEFVPR
jgi:4-amino-4-deoxy-L-arabinose transferase-like glycosyltransferase